MPHLRGLGIREGQWASFPSLPFHPGDRDPSGSRGETVRGPRCGREGVLRGAGQVADPPAAGPRGMWPRRAGPPRSQSAPRPAPSPLPVPPPESPPPLPAPGGGDAAAAASPVASFSLTGEPGGGGTFGGRASAPRARGPASGRPYRRTAGPTDGERGSQTAESLQVPP